MTEANQAYESGDEEKLKAILQNWESSPESVQGEGIAVELIRLIRKIAQCRQRLIAIEKEIELLEDTELYQLREQVISARDLGQDLLADDEKILISYDNNDNKIKLWNLENGDCVQILSEYRSQIPAIELIDHGETFLYIDNGEEIELWKLSYGNELIPSKSVKCNTEKMIDSLIKIGDDRYNSSNYDGAIYSYTKAIDIDHDNADAYSKRSTARSANDDIKGAVEDLQKAQQLLKN